jgi:hypothetical protein
MQEENTHHTQKKGKGDEKKLHGNSLVIAPQEIPVTLRASISLSDSFFARKSSSLASSSSLVAT